MTPARYGHGLLQDRVAIVTGAAKGIGSAIAGRFVREGATVVLADLDGDAARATASTLGDPAEGMACDVAEEDDVAALFSRTIARHRRVDVLVNNAGVTRDGMIHHLDLEDFQTVVDVHLRGSWLCARAALRHMRNRPGGGSVVSMSSISGKVGNLGQTNYAAAKAGVVGLTKAVAREGARFGIRANAIQPGLIRTDMTATMPRDVLEASTQQIPLQRLGDADEVADVALFLASDMSSYVTGVTLEVAGGRHM